MFSGENQWKAWTFSILLNKFFGKRKPFSKNRVLFLAESVRIENATFPYKTVMSKANVKTNRMVSHGLLCNCYIVGHGWVQNGPLTQKRVFLKILFQFIGTSYKELIQCTNDPNVHIPTFRKRCRVLFEATFSLWISLNFNLFVYQS